jgi:hypothetical protein
MAASEGNVKDYFVEGLKASTNDTMEITMMIIVASTDIGAPAEILPSSNVQKSTLKIDKAQMILL